MHVHHAVRVGQGGVDRAVEGETGRVDGPVVVADDVPVHIDLDQVGRGDLGVVQAEGVDEEVVVRPRHAQRDVVVDQLGPAQVGKDAVTGGELHASLPFGVAVAGGFEERVGHGGLLSIYMCAVR